MNLSQIGKDVNWLIYNANPMSIESNQGNVRKTWRGRCLIIVKSDKQVGKIILKASAEGLKPTLVEIESKNK